MNWPTIIIGAIVGIIFIAIVVNEVHKVKSGKGLCACGGSCGSCGACSGNCGGEDCSCDGK